MMKGIALKARVSWHRYGDRAQIIALVFMVVAMLHRFWNEMYRLLLDPSRNGAIDLRLRYLEVHSWFAGEPTYSLIPHAVYPPASYLILWPFLGWLSFPATRWLWAVVGCLALSGLIWLLVREVHTATWRDRTLIILLPLSIYPTPVALGNGQLIILVLPAILAALQLMRRHDSWSSDALAATLFVVALVSPTVAAPFFWIVAFVPGRWRPAGLVVMGYSLLSVVASAFQHAPFASLVQDWLVKGQMGAQTGAVTGGYVNLHSWAASLGLQSLNMALSLFLLGGLGIWLYVHRHTNLWVLLGVSAIVARFWTYHRLYDDLLLLLAMMALWRIAQQGPATDNRDLVAGGLFVLAWIGFLAPARFLAPEFAWNYVMMTWHTVVWTLTLGFLIYVACRPSSL